MENQNNNSGLKSLVIVLSVLFALSLVYIYKLTTDVNSTEAKLTTTLSEKDQVMKDLKDLKTTYDAAIAENTSMSDELIAERDKVVALMEKLKNSNGDVSKYKKQYLVLESKMKGLVAENEILKKDNTVLKVQRDSTIVVLDESKKSNKELAGQNENLTKTVEKGSKLAIVNLKSSAFIVRSSGKEILTDKASRADILKVSFTIAENAIAKTLDEDIAKFRTERDILLNSMVDSNMITADTRKALQTQGLSADDTTQGKDKASAVAFSKKQEAAARSASGAIDVLGGYYQFNLDNLSQASGKTADEIVKLSDEMGLNLYDATLTAVDGLEALGMAIPKTIDELKCSNLNLIFNNVIIKNQIEYDANTSKFS